MGLRNLYFGDGGERSLKIGITGSNGFIGKHLLERLASDGEFIVKTFSGDINNPEHAEDFIQDVDTIVHLAGKMRASDYEILKTNTLGTFNLLQAARARNPRVKLISMSSFQVYKQWDNPEAISEEVIPDPVNVYGLSKRYAEDLCYRYSQDHNIKAVIMRLSNVYGPGCRPDYNSVIATFIHRAYSNQPVRIHGDGSSMRDYIFISDVIDSIVNSIKMNFTERYSVYNICSGRLNSLDDIVILINKNLARPIEIEYSEVTGKEKEYNAGDNRKAVRAGILNRDIVDFQTGIKLTMIEEGKRKKTSS